MAVGQPEKKSSCLKILLGCGIVMVVLCGGGITLAVIFFPKWKAWFETQVAKVQEWEAFAENWDPPPADADTDRLFPDRVADFRRQEMQKVAAAQPGIDLAGSQATYQSGAETMEVFAYQADTAEKNAAFQQFEKAQHQGGNKWFFKLDLPHHSRANFTHGQEHGVLWWSQDWLFLVRTTGEGDPEAFLRSYLEAIAEPAHAPEKPGKPEKPAKGGGEF